MHPALHVALILAVAADADTAPRFHQPLVFGSWCLFSVFAVTYRLLALAHEESTDGRGGGGGPRGAQKSELFWTY